MTHLHADDSTDDARPASITLTTDHVTADAAGPLADALHAAGVAVERHAFLPVRGEEQHPWGVLLLAVSGPPLLLARLVVPATAPAGVAPALAVALGVGVSPATTTRSATAARSFQPGSPIGDRRVGPIRRRPRRGVW